MSPNTRFHIFKFVKNMNMQIWFSKIDFTLIFRLILGVAMMITGYIQNDYTSGSFGLLLFIYAFVAAKYKIGCGYNNCVYTPSKKK